MVLADDPTLSADEKALSKQLRGLLHRPPASLECPHIALRHTG
jgi:hypothetical protein